MFHCNDLKYSARPDWANHVDLDRRCVLEEQSDQGLPYLSWSLDRLDTFFYVKYTLLKY